MIYLRDSFSHLLKLVTILFIQPLSWEAALYSAKVPKLANTMTSASCLTFLHLSFLIVKQWSFLLKILTVNMKWKKTANKI